MMNFQTFDILNTALTVRVFKNRKLAQAAHFIAWSPQIRSLFERYKLIE